MNRPNSISKSSKHRRSVLLVFSVIFLLGVSVFAVMQFDRSSDATATSPSFSSGTNGTGLSGAGGVDPSMTYGVGLTGAPVILDGPPPESDGSVAQDIISIEKYFLSSAINFVFLDIGWGNGANTSTTLVAGGYESWVNNWLYAAQEFGIYTIFFTKQWGYFFSAPSWDVDFLEAYPSANTVNASGVDVPLSDCAGCTSSSGWTVASPHVYQQFATDLRQLYKWYGNYTNWIGFGEGATGDRNSYGYSGTGVKTSRPFDNYTIAVYAKTLFFQNLIDPETGTYLQGGTASDIWKEFVAKTGTYSTATLASEIEANDAQNPTSNVGWNAFLDYEQASINYNLTQMMTALSGRTFVWFTGLYTNIIEDIPNFNPKYVLTQVLGAGGGFGCVSQPSCGGVEDYWSDDAGEKVMDILSMPDQTNVIGWSSFGAPGDNVGGVTPEDLYQQYLIELPQLAADSTLTANDWSWGGSTGLNNFTQTAPMRAFGTILDRMAYTGGYYGTSVSRVKVLWIETSDDEAAPAHLESAVNIRLVSDSDSNLTQFGNLQQFDVIVNPQNIESITPSAESRIIAFVKAGGGIVVDSPPAAWEDNMMGLSPKGSGCCTAPYTVLAGNEITAPYTSLPGYAPYWQGSFTKMSNESAVFDVTDENGYPVVSSDNYYLGRGVFVDMDAARLQYDSFGDSYMTLLMNGILYAAHQDGEIPALWTTTYATTQPWKQIVYTVDGSVGHPLLWVSSNSSSSQVFDVNLNATFYGINPSGWEVIDMQDMAVVSSGTGSDIHISMTVPAFSWASLYIVDSAGANLGPVYSTVMIKSSSIGSGTATLVVQGAGDASSWLILKATSPVTSVSSSLTGAITSVASLALLNQTRIGYFCTSIASSPLGECNAFTEYRQEAWYYDPVDQLLYIHFVGGSPESITVRESGSSTVTTTLPTSSATSPSTALSCSPSLVVVGSPVKCTFTAQGSTTGEVIWSSSGLGKFSAQTCKIYKGACSVKYTPTSAISPVNITGSYQGGANNVPSSGVFTLSVAVKTSKTTISCSHTSAILGSTKVITCKAKVTGYSPTGSVTWSQSGSTGSVNFVSVTCSLFKGTCSIAMTGASAGAVTLHAFYGGDSNNAGSSTDVKLTIRPSKTTLSVSCAQWSVAVGSNVTCTATLAGYAGSVAGETLVWSQSKGPGEVSFSSSSTTTCTLSSGGTCSVMLTAVSEGSTTVKAVYGGDQNNMESSRTCKLTIEP